MMDTGKRATQSLGAPPDRMPRSVRRTSSLQSSWPDGVERPLLMQGTARDLFTADPPAPPAVIGTEALNVRLDAGKRIVAIDGSRAPQALAGFMGLRPGGEMRRAVNATMPGEAAESSLLHRLLDDMPGASFMAGAAWVPWAEAGIDHYNAATGQPLSAGRDVTDVCIGFARGSGTVRDNGAPRIDLQKHAIAPPPLREDDPFAWHDFVTETGPNHRRTRRMDLWREGRRLAVNAEFQDSVGLPDRLDARLIFHEYRLDATLDADSLVLEDIRVAAAVLPYPACLAAPDTARRLIGLPVTQLRAAVPATLPGAAGCTHLNDVLRALQDLAGLAVLLDGCVTGA